MEPRMLRFRIFRMDGVSGGGIDYGRLLSTLWDRVARERAVLLELRRGDSCGAGHVRQANGQAAGSAACGPPDCRGLPGAGAVQRLGCRRRFSIAEKRRIVAAADACMPVTLGALLRREGIYSSLLSSWRKQRGQRDF